MLAPEVWNLKPPAFSFTSKFTENDEELITHSTCSQFVSITFPDTLTIPENIGISASEDGEYYKVEKIQAVEFVRSDFIDLFIKKGRLTALSVGTKLDEDDCFAVTPKGELVLFLGRKSYQQLGIVGKPCGFSRKTPENYIVVINLKEHSFVKGKKNYDNIFKALERRKDLSFDVILAWEPHADMCCPSSIAAYLCSRQLRVATQKLTAETMIAYNKPVPFDIEGCEPSLLTEWIAMINLDCVIPETPNFLNTYQCPEPSEVQGPIASLQVTGLMTACRIKRVLQAIREYLRTESRPCWICLHVQGFPNSPLDGQGKVHRFHHTGDHHWTGFMRDGGTTLSCWFNSSVKRQRAKSRRKRKK